MLCTTKVWFGGCARISLAAWWPPEGMPKQWGTAMEEPAFVDTSKETDLELIVFEA